MNPYEPSGAAPPVVPANPIRQRWIALAFTGGGILSWVSLFYAIKDIRLQTEPGYEQTVHYAGFWACAAFGWLAAIAGVFGIYSAIRCRWHPWKVSLAYLIAGVFLCYAGGFVTAAYITGVEM